LPGETKKNPDRRRALALVIASLMVPAVALALMADHALAAEPQMPEDFQGIWCGGPLGFHEPSSYHSCPTKRSDPDADCYDPNNARNTYWLPACVMEPDPDLDPNIKIEITATGVNFPAISTSCVVREITKFDVCPWGMIYKNKKKAQALRSFQINPWGPGYHIVLQCTSKRSETIGADWLMEKGAISVGDVPRDYRCPWDRRGARLR
jgi:hypothetical protein